MKRAVAIVLSLILIGIQALVAAQIWSDSSSQKASCCTVKAAKCCCVAESESAPGELPAAVTPVVTQAQLVAIQTTLVAWIIPDPTATTFSASTFAPVLAHAIPLFRRDCALLI